MSDSGGCRKRLADTMISPQRSVLTAIKAPRSARRETLKRHQTIPSGEQYHVSCLDSEQSTCICMLQQMEGSHH